MEWISVDSALPDVHKFAGYLVCFTDNQGIKRQCVASYESVSQHCFENSPMHDRWYVYPSIGHEIKPTHWKELDPIPDDTYIIDAGDNGIRVIK